MTASPDHPDGWLVCTYDVVVESDGEVVFDGPPDQAVEVLRQQIVERVIAKYDAEVRANRSVIYNAVQAVAFDEDGSSVRGVK